MEVSGPIKAQTLAALLGLPQGEVDAGQVPWLPATVEITPALVTWRITLLPVSAIR